MIKSFRSALVYSELEANLRYMRPCLKIVFTSQFIVLKIVLGLELCYTFISVCMCALTHVSTGAQRVEKRASYPPEPVIVVWGTELGLCNVQRQHGVLITESPLQSHLKFCFV